MLKIKVEDEYNLYKKHTFEFNEGITCLIGKNGAGKSTLLKEIQRVLKPKNVFYYDNVDSEKFANDRLLNFLGDIPALCRNISSSEGQNIQYNFETVIPKIGAYVKKCVNLKKENAIILLDGLDSGLSIDYIVMLKKELFSLIIDDCYNSHITPYIIIAANNYEFCRGQDCVRVTDAKHIQFKNYTSFRNVYI